MILQCTTFLPMCVGLRDSQLARVISRGRLALRRASRDWIDKWLPFSHPAVINRRSQMNCRYPVHSPSIAALFQYFSPRADSKFQDFFLLTNGKYVQILRATQWSTVHLIISKGGLGVEGSANLLKPPFKV